MITIPYGDKFGGSNTDGPPCTLNGFTGSRNGITVPEYKFTNRTMPKDGAELYEVVNGKEKLVAIFDEEVQKFTPINRRWVSWEKEHMLGIKGRNLDL